MYSISKRTRKPFRSPLRRGQKVTVYRKKYATGRKVLIPRGLMLYRPEQKFFDTDSGLVTLGAAWGTVGSFLNAVAQGTLNTNRIGRVYSITSLSMRGHFATLSAEAQAAPADGIAGKIKLVVDTQTNGTVLTPGDVMDETIATFPTYAHRNLAFTDRFKVLKTCSATLNSQISQLLVNDFSNASVKGGEFEYFTRFDPPIKVQCELGTTGAITLITDNTLHLIGCAEAASLLTVRARIRIRFTG